MSTQETLDEGSSSKEVGMWADRRHLHLMITHAGRGFGLRPGQASVTDNASSHRSSRSLWTTRFGRVEAGHLSEHCVRGGRRINKLHHQAMAHGMDLVKVPYQP